MQGIQYKALRIIFKEKVGVSRNHIHNKAKINTIKERFNKISSKYLNEAIKNNNRLIIDLTNNLINSSGLHKTPKERIREMENDI